MLLTFRHFSRRHATLGHLTVTHRRSERTRTALWLQPSSELVSPLESPLATFVADLKAGCHSDLARSKLFDATWGSASAARPSRVVACRAALAVVSAPSSSVSLEQKAPDIAATVASAKAALSDDDMDCTDDQPTLLPLRALERDRPPRCQEWWLPPPHTQQPVHHGFTVPQDTRGHLEWPKMRPHPHHSRALKSLGFPAAHQHAPSGPGGQPALLHRSLDASWGGHMAGLASPVAPATGAIQPHAPSPRSRIAPRPHRRPCILRSIPRKGCPLNQHRGAAMAHVPPPGAGPSAHAAVTTTLASEGIPEPLEQRRDSSRWNAAPSPSSSRI